MNLRVTHNFTPNVAGRGGRGGPGGGGGGQGWGRRPRWPRRAAGAERQHDRAGPIPQERQRSDERLSRLGGTTTGSSLAVPVTLNIVHKRILHNVTVNFSRTRIIDLQQFRVRGGRDRRGGIAGVVHRSVRLGLAAAVVLEPLEPARRHAVPPNRFAAVDGLRLDPSIDQAHAAGRRGRAPRQHQQPDRREPPTVRSSSPGSTPRAGPRRSTAAG